MFRGPMRTPIFPPAVMRFTIGSVFYCSLFAAAASSQSIGSEPSPMEAFAGQEGVRMTWSSEVARWEQNGTLLILVAVALEDKSQPTRKLRGVKVELSSEKAKDQVYLDEQATERTRSALKEISEAVVLTGMPAPTDVRELKNSGRGMTGRGTGIMS